MNRSKLAAAGLGVLALIAPIAAAFASSANAAPTAAAPTVAEGQILRADGSPAPGVRVNLGAMITYPQGWDMPAPIGTTVTDSTGHWSIQSLKTPPASTTSMEIAAVVDGRIVIHDYDPFPAAGPSAGSTAKRMAAVADTGLRPADVTLQVGVGEVTPGGRVAPPATTATATTTVTAMSDGTDQALATDVEAAEDSTGPLDAPTSIPDGAYDSSRVGSCCFWANLNEYKKVWVPLKVSRTLSHSVLHYNFKTSTQTDLEIVVTASGDVSSGGLSGSLKEDTSMTLSPDWPHNTSKLVKAQWQYRRQRAWTYGGPPPSDPPTPTNTYRWKANKPLGYTKSLDNNPTFDCKTSGPIGSKVTMDNTTSVTWGGWYSIAGFSLDDKQTQSTQTSLTIDPDDGETARYCGSGSTLATSPFLREIPKT